jgi:hypothetical protein
MCHLTAVVLSVFSGLQASEAVSSRAVGRIPALHSATLPPAIKPPIF